MSFEIGTKVGSYEIIESLGKGGMATVYKAYHARLDRYVAIKVLHAFFKDDDSFLRRFTREARVVARLEHAHIVPVYDFAEHEGHPYLVMRYIAGETLKERLSKGALKKPELLQIASAVAGGLAYAHSQGVLHRDVKPSNILLTKGERVYIADFGLARITQAGESTMSQDMIMGTPQYISPEQAKGLKELDGRTDVYSFGIVLYEMLTGRVPFQSDTSYSIIHSQIFDEPPKPSAINDKISPPMEAVLLKALEKQPEDRYASISKLIDAFIGAATDIPTEFAPLAAVVDPAVAEARTQLAEPEASEAGAGLPPLPELAAELDDSPEPELGSEVKPSRKRSLAILGAGLLAGMCLCAALLFVMSRINQAEEAEATTMAMTVEASANGAVVEPPASDQQNEPVPAPAGEEPDSSDAPFFDLPVRDELLPSEEIERQLAADPDNNQLRAELALAYLREDRRDDARTLAREMLSNTRLPIGYISLAERLLVADQLEMAGIVIEVGLDKFRNEPRLQQMLMMIFVVREAPERQVQTYVDRLSEEPHDTTHITIQIGEAYLAYRRGDLQMATDILNELMVDNNPYAADVLFLLGNIFLGQGNRPDARIAFEEAMAQRPSPWLAARIDRIILEEGLN